VTRKPLLVAVSVLALGGLSAGIAIAASGGDDDRPLTGSTVERAKAAALDHTGGGVVVETEAGDDGAAYGVEIRLDDGTVVEVSLDESFGVIGSEGDEDGPNDDDGPGDSGD
jgi:uncharacterized membrane protein YkoI